MNRLDLGSRVLVVATLLAAMSVFMRATPTTLAALVLGGAMVVFGTLYSYRPGAITGVFIVATSAASSIVLDSLLEVRMVLTAVLGLLVPLLLLTLYALGTEPEDARMLRMRRGPIAGTLAFCLACVMAAPIVAGLLSLAVPPLGARLSGTVEVAIALLAVAIGSILLTRREPARRTIGSAMDTTGDSDEQVT